jgi:hypothetical protein
VQGGTAKIHAMPFHGAPANMPVDITYQVTVK